MPDINMQHFGELQRNQHSIDVEIDASQVTSPQQNFPMMLETPNSSNSVLNVVAINELGEQLPTEIEGIANDKNWIHFKDMVHSRWNRKMKIFYGGCIGKPASDSTYGSEAVWNSDYNMAQLMNTAANANILDSTSNGINSTSANNFEAADTVDGNYGKGIIADGVNEYCGFGDVLDLNDMSFTIEMRLKGFEWSSDMSVIISKWYDGTNAEWNFTGIDDGISGTKLNFAFRNQADENKNLFSNDAFDTTIEHTIQINYDGTTHRLYVDGALHDSNVTTAIRQGNNAELRFFRYVHPSFNFYGAGTIYQLRMSQNTYRDANWAVTTHNNLNNPTANGNLPFYKLISKEHNFVKSLQSLGRAG